MAVTSFPRFVAVMLGVAATGRLKREDEHWFGDVAGGCPTPRLVELSTVPRVWGRPRVARVEPTVSLEGALLTGTLAVPCGKCEHCLRVKRARWAERMALEIDHAERTWFVTLTYRPSARARAMAEVGDVKGAELARRLYPGVQKWLKRLRWHAGEECLVRYFCVAEFHADGWPHWHLLVHGSRGLDRAVLRRGHWQEGFVDMRVVRPGRSRDGGSRWSDAVWYLSKYLWKDAPNVLRCSLGYGNPHSTAWPYEEVGTESSDAVAADAASPAQSAPQPDLPNNGAELPEAAKGWLELLRECGYSEREVELLLMPEGEVVADSGALDVELFAGVWNALPLERIVGTSSVLPATCLETVDTVGLGGEDTEPALPLWGWEGEHGGAGDEACH